MMTCTGRLRIGRIFIGRNLSLRIFAVAMLASACADAPTALEEMSGDGAGAKPLRVVVEVLAPTGGATLSGTQLFSGRVAALALSEYTLHWQVDGGTLSAAMQNSTEGGPHKRAAVDVSGWTWRGAGPYTVTMVARDTKGRTLGQASVSVMVAPPPTTPPPPPPPPPPGGTNPLAAAPFWVDPNSNARKQADAWRASRPADAAQMDRVAAQPQAVWFGDWNTDVRAAVAAMTQTIVAAGALPVYVAYNIPVRDCNSYSAGGATSAAAYRAWIRAFATGLGNVRAVVILEPDALAGINCLSTTLRDERSDLIADAVQVLRAQGSAVYVDAGHSSWISASEMANRLRRAGVDNANGFSLNISNFQATANLVTYGNTLSSLLGDKHYVLDTSRNGLGPTADNQWCNPDGRALGNGPSAWTGLARVDAFLWIKRPGESDGTCNGGPRAGTWWAEYALGLAQRAPTLVAYTH
jgi:endoglucanase